MFKMPLFLKKKQNVKIKKCLGLTHAQQWVTRILGKKSLFFKGGFWAFLTKKMGEIKMSLIIIIKKKKRSIYVRQEDLA